jgi:ubiquinone/menaquinone biosynthesis C-methylase UbiE
MRMGRKLTIMWRTSVASRKIANYFKHRRVKEIDKLMHGQILNPIKNSRILELGCGLGLDFIQFLPRAKEFSIYGLDLVDKGISAKNFNMIVGDAENIKFPDDYFDFLISIGVLEHIQPFEKLANVVTEIKRVSKSYCIIVPSIITLLEPHTQIVRWQLRDYQKKKQRNRKLNYFSDSNWLAFNGFKDANIKRFSYIPLFINNLIIYKYNNKL